MSRFTIMCCIHDRSHSVLLLCNPSVFCFRHRIIVHFAFFNVTCILFLIFFLSLYHLFQLVFLHHWSSSTRFFLSGWVVFAVSWQQLVQQIFFVGVVSCTQNHRNYSNFLGVEIPVFRSFALLREEVLVGFGSCIFCSIFAC